MIQDKKLLSNKEITKKNEFPEYKSSFDFNCTSKGVEVYGANIEKFNYKSLITVST